MPALRAALAAQQAAQAATVAASPFSWAFQLVWLASHLFLVALVGSACLTLAVLPVWDTLCAGRVRAQNLIRWLSVVSSSAIS